MVCHVLAINTRTTYIKVFMPLSHLSRSPIRVSIIGSNYRGLLQELNTDTGIQQGPGTRLPEAGSSTRTQPHVKSRHAASHKD